MPLNDYLLAVGRETESGGDPESVPQPESVQGTGHLEESVLLDVHAELYLDILYSSPSFPWMGKCFGVTM